LTERYAEYDRLARFYHRYWGGRYHQKALTVLDRILLPHIPPNAKILDLCCGTGHLTEALAGRGYRMTGIDGSEAMLRYAREALPAGEFILADARTFDLPDQFQAVISTFDSLNHVMTLGELARVFENVYRSLVPGGLFVFDLNMEEAYQTQWQKSSAIVEEEQACIVQGGYEPTEKIGRTDITMFYLEEGWRRSDLTLYQKCYTSEEICTALGQAGFIKLECHDMQKISGMAGDIGIGRMFFLARKPD
jgi:SAM-dependent methyltransferase